MAIEYALAEFLNVPVEFFSIDQVFMFLIVPWLLMIVIVYAVLEEIRLFRRPGINAAIAILGSLVLIPTGVLGQFIFVLYGAGFTTILGLFMLMIIVAFIRSFGPKIGIYGPLLSLMTAGVYAVTVYWAGQIFFPENSYILWASIAVLIIILIREEWKKIPKTPWTKVGHDFGRI